MKIFACAARYRCIGEIGITLFNGLVEAEYLEEAERKTIEFIKRVEDNCEIVQLNVTDRYFDDENETVEKRQVLPDFDIEESDD